MTPPPLNGWTRFDAHPITKDFTLCVGEHPYGKREGKREIQTGQSWLNAHFTAVINVGDDANTVTSPAYKIRNYWYPIQETGAWPYSTLFAVKRTLDHLLAKSEKGNFQRVLLHCHGGVNRSQTLAQLWIESLAAHNGGPLTHVPKIERAEVEIEKNLIKGHLPAGSRSFLATMNAHPHYGCMGVLQEANLYRGDIAQSKTENRIWHALHKAGFSRQDFTLETAIQKLLEERK